MFMKPDAQGESERLAKRLTRSGTASTALFADVFAASARAMTLRTIGKTRRLDQLVTFEAWTEAALEFVKLDAPSWTLQRLCQDDGEWLCTFTRFPDLPGWLDDSAEGRHPVMALAILGALLEIRSQTAIATSPIAHQMAGGTADCSDYR